MAWPPALGVHSPALDGPLFLTLLGALLEHRALFWIMAFHHGLPPAPASFPFLSGYPFSWLAEPVSS